MAFATFSQDCDHGDGFTAGRVLVRQYLTVDIFDGKLPARFAEEARFECHRDGGNKNIHLQKLADHFKQPLSSLLLIDDDPNNVENARKLGTQALTPEPPPRGQGFSSAFLAVVVGIDAEAELAAAGSAASAGGVGGAGQEFVDKHQGGR